MKHAILAAVAVFATGAVGIAQAQAAPSSVGGIQPNDASLNVLLTEWNRAGFLPPSKPSQYRVDGRNGLVTSGVGYNALVSSIRAAVRDTRLGRENEAAMEIATARGLMAKVAGSKDSDTTAPSDKG